ncbi:MAG: Uma2 family endonuclease [Anaerolineae bacterium]
MARAEAAMTDDQGQQAGDAWFFPPQGKWTEAHYLTLPQTQRLVELAHGRLIITSPPGAVHQQVVRDLTAMLQTFLRGSGQGRVLNNPTLRLSPNLLRRPDIVYLPQSRTLVHEPYLQEIPLWIAEVIDPDTRAADELEKMAEYAAAGVAEYWLVDPEHQSIAIHVREGEQYAACGVLTRGQVAESRVIVGFRAQVAQIV